MPDKPMNGRASASPVDIFPLAPRNVMKTNVAAVVRVVRV
jgi:hypothetical protein